MHDLPLGAEQQAMLEDFERRRRARSLAVPTEDKRVRLRLRRFGVPITLFGEGPGDRRDRLRELMTARFEAGLDIDGNDSENADSDDDSESDSEDQDSDEEFYYPGGEYLVDTRQYIAQWSLPRASKRLAAQRAEVQVSVISRKKTKLEWFTHLKGQKERVSGISFHPGSTLSQNSRELNVVTSGMDGTVNLHNFESDLPVGELLGHKKRVARVNFHPSGRFIGTASYDRTWRFWDAETTVELFMQKGHSREVFDIGFQGDGALVATAGLDAVGRVWDLRSGRSIMVLQGHVKPIFTLDWSPDCHTLATGSEDNTIRVWDVRQAKSTYTIPAHTNLVSNVKFWTAGDGFESTGAGDSWKMTDPPRFSKGEDDDVDMDPAVDMRDSDDDDENGARDVDKHDDGSLSLRKQLLTGGHLVSSSYDGTCKIFSVGDWKPLKSLAGLESKVTVCDVSGDGRFIATASYDRTFKLFAPE
ncbi:hypothetical protein HDU82_008833 [Entophlyctis luteolus]|nr:hypothetical protein HDU82_008833 [Entophlyctis luteolus]